MTNYVIELNYVASIRVSVSGDFNRGEPEGAALAAAREKAEEADINEFSIGNELEARIIERNEL